MRSASFSYTAIHVRTYVYVAVGCARSSVRLRPSPRRQTHSHIKQQRPTTQPHKRRNGHDTTRAAHLRQALPSPAVTHALELVIAKHAAGQPAQCSGPSSQTPAPCSVCSCVHSINPHAVVLAWPHGVYGQAVPTVFVRPLRLPVVNALVNVHACHADHYLAASLFLGSKQSQSQSQRALSRRRRTFFHFICSLHFVPFSYIYTPSVPKKESFFLPKNSTIFNFDKI